MTREIYKKSAREGSGDWVVSLDPHGMELPIGKPSLNVRTAD